MKSCVMSCVRSSVVLRVCGVVCGVVCVVFRLIYGIAFIAPAPWTRYAAGTYLHFGASRSSKACSAVS